MSGAFRFFKSILASLTLAVVAFVMHYGQSYLFRSVEEPGSGLIVIDDVAQPKVSLSRQRSITTPDAATWNMAVVTNRQLDDAPIIAAGTDNFGATRSLVDLVKDAMYQIPGTTYGQAPVRVSLRRKRGVCKLGPDGVDVGTLSGLTRDAFLSSIAKNSNAAKDVLVFVHGFNVSLEEATARAAQVAEDMPFHGTMIVFSWQSAAKTRAYLKDEKLAERNFWNLAELLADLKRTCDPETRLHVLAHSMGNRVTLRAVEALCGTIDPAGQRDPIGFARFFGRGQTTPQLPANSIVSVAPAELKQIFPDWGSWHVTSIAKPKIDTLILVAPDVAVSEFSQSVQNIKASCDRMVLYSSDTDYALKSSGKIHKGKYRAGDSRANIDLDGLYTVRVSGVDANDPLGHSYYGTNPKVLEQLAALFRPKFDPLQTVTQFANRGGKPAH